MMLTSLFRQKRFKCEVTSISTEKLSSPCHNQWFDTVSTNLGTSLGFDHNDKKMCVSSRLPRLFFGKLFYWRAMSLTLALLDSGRRNYRGELHEILIKCFKNFVYPSFARRKKGKSRTLFQNILFLSQFMNCFIAARGKSKIETTGASVK